MTPPGWRTPRPAVGDQLETLSGWQNSGHGDFNDIRGVIVHHTGNSRESASSIRRGRPDLDGPLAIFIGPDGTVTVVAVGVLACGPWLARLAADQQRELAHDRHRMRLADTAPRPAIGLRPRERWPDAQIIAMRDTCAALALKLGVDADRIIGHKEWAGVQGKWDPGNMDMDRFRGEVTKAMHGEFPKPPLDVRAPLRVAQPPILAPPTNPRSDRALLEEIYDVRQL